MCSELECYDNADYRWRKWDKTRYKTIGKTENEHDSQFGHSYVDFWNAELRAHYSACKGYVYGSVIRDVDHCLEL
jgi:hypothetical protein